MDSLLCLANTHSSCLSPHTPGPILSSLSLPVWEGPLCSSTPLGTPLCWSQRFGEVSRGREKSRVS